MLFLFIREDEIHGHTEMRYFRHFSLFEFWVIIIFCKPAALSNKEIKRDEGKAPPLCRVLKKIFSQSGRAENTF